MVNALITSHGGKFDAFDKIAKSQKGMVIKNEGSSINGTALRTGCLNEEINAKHERNEMRYDIWLVSGSKK